MMRRGGYMKPYAIISIRTLTFAVALAHAAFGGNDGLALKSQLPDGWLADYKPDVPMPARIAIEGRDHLLFSHAGDLENNSDPTGMPMLPVDLIMLGVPEGASLHVELLNPTFETLEQQDVAPFPTYVTNDKDEQVAEYKKSAPAYDRSDLYPSRQFVVDPPTNYRDQQIASIRLSPYQYNPVTKSLRRLVSGTLKISLRSSDGRSMPIPPAARGVSDPLFEKTFKHLIWNYDQAKGWRVRKNVGDAAPDPSRDWFETGKDYYRIPIAEDGWYRITKAQLVSAGANGNLIDVPTLKLFSRGQQVPVLVRPDTSVEFYGYRNYGDTSYADFWTDTSVYWLTWGGAAGLRFQAGVSHPGTEGRIVVSTLETKHFEENNWYYQGAGNYEITLLDAVPGEGWGWGKPNEWFYPGVRKRIALPLEHKHSLGTFNVRARLFGTIAQSQYTPPRHTVQFYLNDTLIGTRTFPLRAECRFDTTLSISHLRAGLDTLTIQSADTGQAQFYLDWIEMRYPRQLRAINDQLTFTVPAFPGSNPSLIEVNGFTNSLIDVVDLTTRRKIDGGIVSGDSLIGYTIAFKDTLSGSHTYLVQSRGGARNSPSVAKKRFVDIRANTIGADYIVITHRNFLSAAQQLAAYRRNHNGVRTATINIQDVYDEFNYGVMNALKLKSFLRHAYESWPQPRPSYLLMFGDASWDFHNYLNSTASFNFVPAHGVPSGDNWFVCFNPDTSALAQMFVGRIPVRDSTQAARIVPKLAGYDARELGDWAKTFMFITGGGNPSEWSEFANLSTGLINRNIAPAPVGGNVVRFDKTTISYIDGGLREPMKQAINNGCGFVNFLGHSGGRIWSLDIGPPADLQNTDGRLPFIASVSCWIAGFADPGSVMLSEDFVLADNRAAIAAWGSSTTGYAQTGTDLVDYFLEAAKRDTIRDFGALTTIARTRLLRFSPNGYANTVHLNPLIGDPLSRLALPVKPDLAISSTDIRSSNPVPTPNDTSVTIRLDVKNYGLVPSDSVGVTLTDVFAGETQLLPDGFKLPATRYRDSVFVRWDKMYQVGRHTLRATLDPAGRIGEVNELNNIASVDQYVYANLLSVVKPLKNMVVLPGTQRLVVSSPIGLDSVGYSYEFELDTVDTFDSPFRIASGFVVPGAVSGEWGTPPLTDGNLYFWRSRTRYGSSLGNWVVSSFSTATSIPASPLARVREYSRKQFRRNTLSQAVVTDSGITIAPNPPIAVYCRSVGLSYNQEREYYSKIIANQVAISGYWWEVASSFIGVRVNEFTGATEFRFFPLYSAHGVPGGPPYADEMKNFIRSTPAGNYLAFAVIFDGRTNVSESLYVALESLGSTQIRQAVYGQSWAFIGRKGNGGPGMPPLEILSNDTAVVQFQIPNYYSAAKGSQTSSVNIPASFNEFRWQWSGLPATQTRIAFLGVRPDNTVDTIRILPRDSLLVNLDFLNSITSGERYKSLRTAALLSSSDALITPTFREWTLDLTPPADLAVSVHTIMPADDPTVYNLSIAIHNIGYRLSDSANVAVSIFDRNNRARKLASAPVGAIDVNQSQTVILSFSTTNFPRRPTLQIEVAPAKKAKDLVAENNIAYYSFVTPPGAVAQDIHVFADGAELMDGDYISPTPMLLVKPKEFEGVSVTGIELYLDGRRLGEHWSNALAKRTTELTMQSAIADGDHELRVRVLQQNSFGEVDSLERSVLVRVLAESRLLNVLNYPNPFQRETYFTFTLTGSAVPQQLRLKIFSVTGRKIREILVSPYELHLGFNRIFWDGRDDDGDEVANGYYFYQVAADAGNKVITSTEKLVKVR